MKSIVALFAIKKDKQWKEKRTVKIKVVFKWAIIGAITLAMFYLARGQAYAARGYGAHGGEYVVLVLPLVWCLASRVWNDWKAMVKEAMTDAEV